MPINIKSKLGFPSLPAQCPKISIDGTSLSYIRDYMTNLPPDPVIQEAILSVIKRWLDKHDISEPLADIKSILDSIRLLSRNHERMNCMNTFVRTLGQPEIFATFLDILRDSSRRLGTNERILSEVSLKAKEHAVYGWCGQTKLAVSSSDHTNGTMTPGVGVQEMLGETPVSTWVLSMHIWQPNPHAKGFLCGNRSVQSVIAEPPHSHPFDFVSAVVIGKMHQSIYAQCGSQLALIKKQEGKPQKGTYDGIKLEHVHGVWPPHDYREVSELITLEDRVVIDSGDSYYMSCDTIHDVQIDATIASIKPTITLFLRSESFVKSHVYMAAPMADFHALYPDYIDKQYPLEDGAWNKKLELLADYVRGKSKILNLDDVVNYNGEYAFFHI
jgi:hypothetical protein